MKVDVWRGFDIRISDMERCIVGGVRVGRTWCRWEEGNWFHANLIVVVAVALFAEVRVLVCVRPGSVVPLPTSVELVVLVGREWI